MITNGKEYPATHSMSTSWFFVDQDDNVAIFDFQDNGPIPKMAESSDHSIEEFCFWDAFVEKDGMKVLPYTDEQVLEMLEGWWESEVKDDYYWGDDFFQIDKTREKEFFDYLREAREKMKEDWEDAFIPICLSKELGIYVVNLCAYDYGEGFKNPYAKYLFESGIVLRYGQYPNYYDADVEWNAQDPAAAGKKKAESIHCPYFLYVGQDYARYPHIRVSVPKHPVKYSQLPPQFKKMCARMNMRFKDTAVVQITHEFLCQSWVETQDHVGTLLDEEGHEYIEVIMPNGEWKFVLNSYSYPVDEPDAEHYPLVPSDEFIERLKQLDVNKFYISVKEYYDD